MQITVPLRNLMETQSVHHHAGFSMATFFDDGNSPSQRPLRMAEHRAFASQTVKGLVRVMHCGPGMLCVET